MALSKQSFTAVVVALTALMVVALPPACALAHAELVSWAFSGAGPGNRTMLLHFGEVLDPAFVQVQIFDRGSRVVPGTSTHVDPASGSTLRVTLPSELPAGTYRASWWVRSADGDASQNAFHFSTGGPIDPLAMLPPPDARDPATSPPASLLATAVTALLRWAGLVAALLVAGGACFMMFLWRPAVPRGSLAEADRALVHSFRMVCFEAATALVFSGVLLLLLQAEVARLPLLQPAGATQPLLIAPSPLEHQVPARAVGELLASSYGRLWLIRCALGVLIGVLGLSLPLERDRRPWHWVLLLLTGWAALLTFSLTGHAAVSPSSGIATAADWTHLLAASIWLGGLPPLILALRSLGSRDSGVQPTRLVSRFSTFALPAMIYLGVSGAYAYTVHVGSPVLLLETTYGVTLAVKLGLFAVLVVIGAWSRHFMLPQLQAGRAEARHVRFSRSLPVELGVGMALVLCVGLMLSLATARDAWTAHLQIGFAAQQEQDGVVLTLRAVDLGAEGSALAVDIKDRRNLAGQGPALVSAKLGGERLDLAQIPLSAIGIERFGTARGGLAGQGIQRVTIEYARGGLHPVTAEFVLDPR